MLCSGQKREARKSNPVLSKTVTARANRSQPIYRWFVYPHSFTREFVHWALGEIQLRKDGIVMDPFLGAGTTLLACKEVGIPAVGFDMLPLSVLIANVKVRNYRLQTLKGLWEALQERGWPNSENEVPDIPILSKAFDPAVLERILSIQHSLRSLGNKKYADFFLVGLLSIVGHVSKTEKGGGWLRLCPEKVVYPEEVDSRFVNAIELMLSDLEQSPRRQSAERNWEAHIADARNLPNSKKFDAVISSPPYLNRHDYTRIFSLELALPFLKNHDELKKLRYRSLRSHVEAKKTFSADGYKVPSLLEGILDTIKKTPLNNNNIPSMIRGYFEDLYCTLKGLYPLVKENGHIVFVLGNVRFAGIIIPVDEIVAEIGEQVGLRWQKTVVARYRGNSAQQMGKFGRELSRESVIIWRK
jgi:DNA modification methylase